MAEDVQQFDEAREAPLFSNKSTYEDLLLNPPPTRKRGLRWDYWFVIFFGVLTLYLCVTGLVLVPLRAKFLDSLSIGGLDIYAVLLGPLLGCLILFVMFYTLPALGTQRKIRSRYPRAFQMVRKIPNRQRGEINNARLLFLLNIEGRRIFLPDFSIQGSKYPIGGALLSEDATLIDNNELFRQAQITLNYASAIVMGHANTSHMRDLAKAELRKIPNFRKILEQNYPRFERLALTESASRVMEGLERVEWAYQERTRFLNASYAYAKAGGYWSADEYFYEDAKRFRELDVAFARQLSEQYLPDVKLRATVAAALIKAVNANRGGWRNRSKLIQALEFLVGANLVLEHWIKMSTTEVDEQMERLQKGYREKLDELRGRGFKVVSG